LCFRIEAKNQGKIVGIEESLFSKHKNKQAEYLNDSIIVNQN